MKLGFILTNNVEFIQIDDQEETNQVPIKNFKPKTEDICHYPHLFEGGDMEITSKP